MEQKLLEQPFFTILCLSTNKISLAHLFSFADFTQGVVFSEAAKEENKEFSLFRKHFHCVDHSIDDRSVYVHTSIRNKDNACALSVHCTLSAFLRSYPGGSMT